MPSQMMIMRWLPKVAAGIAVAVAFGAVLGIVPLDGVFLSVVAIAGGLLFRFRLGPRLIYGVRTMVVQWFQ